MNKQEEVLKKVLGASTKEELMQAYDGWAGDYDRDLTGDMAYVAPQIASKLLHTYENNKDIHLLDAGCGTGLVAENLKNLGYNQIDGLDYSQSMLEQAEKKQIYKNLFQADLSASLHIAENQYDAVICVGAFTCGHVGPEAFSELIRIVKPGGHICFTVRDKAWEEDSYVETIKAIEEEGSWKLLEAKNTDYIQQEGSKCKICLYQVAV